jgi:acyl carrier protein
MGEAGTLAQREKITADLLDYIYATNPLAKDHAPLPQDRSLIQIGVMDSFAIIELVFFIEKKWSIQIYDSELTMEKFGGIDKMVTVIIEKLSSSGRV